MSQQDLRRLPVAVAPFPAETLDSYLARVLAAANYLQPGALAEYLQRRDASGGP